MVFQRLNQFLRGASSAPAILPPDPLPSSAIAKKAPYVFPVFLNGQAAWVMDDFMTYVTEGFNMNAVIYSAIMYKAKALAKARLRAYLGDPANPERLPPDHPLSMLCARPNPHQSWLEFQQQRIVHLNIAGNSYTWLDRPTRQGLPSALYNLRPDRVTIVPDRNGIKGYVYSPDDSADRSMPFLAQDVIHIKFPNPSDPLEGMGYGLSPLAPLAQSGDVDNAITTFFKLFVDRGAMPSGVLHLGEATNNDEINRVKARWREQYGGIENWTEIVVLDADTKYERIGLTAKEMGFDTLDARNESRIIGPFGVPPQLIFTRYGLERNTFSNAEEARKACWEDTLLPELELFKADDEYYLRDDSGAWVDYDLSTIPALRENIGTQIDSAYKLWQMGVPANQAVSTVGLKMEEIPGGDIGWLPSGVQPVGINPGSTGLLPGNSTGAIEDSPNAVEDTRDGGAQLRLPPTPQRLRLTGGSPPKADSSITAPGWSEAEKAQMWAKADQIAQSHEEAFADAARAQFRAEKREVLAIIKEVQRDSLRRKAMIDWSFAVPKVETLLQNAGEDWRSKFAPLIFGVVDDAAGHWNMKAGLEFDVRNLQAEQWYNDYLMVFSDRIRATSSKQIGALLQQGTQEGWSIGEMQTGLTQMFEQWISGSTSAADFAGERLPPYRTEMIARTETMRAYNAGSMHIYAYNGVEQMEWLATLDGRERETHAEANGQIVDLNDNFIVGGYPMEYPGDPSAPPEETVNCRCTIAPVIGGVKEETPDFEENPVLNAFTNEPFSADQFEKFLTERGINYNDWYDATRMYTDGKFGIIRDAQLGRIADAKEAEKWLRIADTIESGMRNLPVYQGDIYRSLELTALDAFRGGVLEVGQTIQMNALSSFARHPTFMGADRTFLHVVQNMSGVAVENISQYLSEAEVIVPPSAKYQITQIIARTSLPKTHELYSSTGGWLIELVETIL